MRSLLPSFYGQSRHSLELAEIPCRDHESMRQRSRGNHQIALANGSSCSRERVPNGGVPLRRVSIERDNVERREKAV